MTTSDSLREDVRRKYAEAALAVTEGSGCGCGSGACCEATESAPFVSSGAFTLAISMIVGSIDTDAM